MERRVHAACINASNPYHECTEYCFRMIAEVRERSGDATDDATDDAPTVSERDSQPQSDDGKRKREEEDVSLPAAQDEVDGEAEVDIDESGLNERQKKLRLLQRKVAEARKANQAAMIAERKQQEAPKEQRGVSKQKWFEEKQKVIGKRLEFSGLDKSKTYMLDTQEAAATKYKKWEKEPAPFGWDVFNQKSLYKAYKKRAKNIPNTMDDYLKARDADPDFYRDETCLQYGKTPEIPEENVNKMVQELEERRSKRKEFSRRRRFHDEKDIDSINDRNEHFNRKIERAFGKYTVEIKNNLERGTALPD